MGGQLAAQALANAAAALVFWFALKLKLVSFIPTALRIGAGYGVAMLVGVLGMRSLGLLVPDSFVLSTFTWETVSQVLCRFATESASQSADKPCVLPLRVLLIFQSCQCHIWILSVDGPSLNTTGLACPQPWRASRIDLVIPCRRIPY